MKAIAITLITTAAISWGFVAYSFWPLVEHRNKRAEPKRVYQVVFCYLRDWDQDHRFKDLVCENPETQTPLPWPDADSVVSTAGNAEGTMIFLVKIK